MLQTSVIEGKALRPQGILDAVQRTHSAGSPEAIVTALRQRAVLAGVRFDAGQLDRLSDAIAHGFSVQLDGDPAQ